MNCCKLSDLTEVITAQKLDDLIGKYRNKILEHRIWLHRNPEKSGEEKISSEYIVKALREIGLFPREKVGGYGVTAMIEGSEDGKCLGLRADFDALPAEERTGLPFSSLNTGVFHACGHDAHAAMLLGAAYILNELRDKLWGSVKLIFQPSEENSTASGAKAMIADGVLNNPTVDGIIGQHVWPNYKTGTAAIRNGAMSAASDRFFITVRGKSTHVSVPEKGIDAIVIAAQIISALQTIISRRTNPFDSAIISIGSIHGGKVYNIVADEVILEGTCRTLNSKVRQQTEENIKQIVSGITQSMGGSCEFKYLRCYSPVVNDPAMTECICNAIVNTLGEENMIVPGEASMIGEDFSFYCEHIPCAYYWLGCRTDGKEFVPLHSNRFYPDEDALCLGVKIMVRSALQFLTKRNDKS